MRYIDIDLLDIPPGWQARADHALDELRAEVTDADAQARVAGEDVSVARRKAISEGLKKSERQAIWGDLKTCLAKLRNDKCWYSESKNPASDKNVDHFRPKSRVAEDPDHEGYWWLAFTWRNYRYSSQWCNQRRIDVVNGTSGGKADGFPLCSGSFRARLESDDCELERPELLDPIDPNDWKILTFRQDGHATPAKQPGTIEYQRAEKSIEVYHLLCNELVKDRRVLAGRIQRMVQSLETLYPRITDPKLQTLYKHHEKELLRAIDQDAEYSAAALAYAKAEVYTNRAGQLTKRDWLEEILA